MNAMILTTCITIVTASSALSLDLWQKANAKNGEAHMVDGRISRIQADLAVLSSLPDRRIGPITQTYAEVIDCLRMLSRFHDLKSSILVESASEGQDVRAAAKRSEWPGVGQLSLKVSFTEVAGMDNYLRILEALNTLKQKYPINIARIHQSGVLLDVAINVFGTVE